MKAAASAVLVLALALTLVVPTYAQPTAQQQQFPVIQLPAGYTIEKVADKLTYATSLTWDDQGRM